MKQAKMFNPAQKELFLLQNPMSQSMESLFRNLFDLVAPYEEEKQKDISSWRQEEYRAVLEVLSGFRDYSSDNRAKLLRRYVKWCVDTGIPGASNAVFGMRADGYAKVREMTLSGPAHLQRILDAVFDPVSDVTADNIIRGYCWLSFSGLNDFDTVNVRASDVDPDALLVRYGDAEYPLCPEAVPCLRILREMGAFRYYHPGYDNEFIWRPRREGDKLLRSIRAPEPNVTHIRSALSKAVGDSFRNGDIDVKISHFRIWISGEFYRAHLRELKGEEPDFSHLADRVVRLREENGAPYKLDSGVNKRTERAKKREISANFKKDYLRWKLAYAGEL